ncbi:MAG: hypothetical protein ACYDA6_10835 [Solirubrobacteraceae bacterium]
MADPGHDEHHVMLDWLGLDDACRFDPTAVAAEDIGDELALSGAGR